MVAALTMLAGPFAFATAAAPQRIALDDHALPDLRAEAPGGAPGIALLAEDDHERPLVATPTLVGSAHGPLRAWSGSRLSPAAEHDTPRRARREPALATGPPRAWNAPIS